MKTMTKQSFLKNPFFLLAFIAFIFLSGIFALVFPISFFLTLFVFGYITALILLFRDPRLLLFILIIVRMSLDYSSQYFGITIYETVISLSQLLGIGIALIGCILLFLKRTELAKYPLKFPFYLLFLWGGMTLFYSIAPRASLQELLRIFDLFALSFLAYTTIKSTIDFKHLLQAFFVSSILPLLFGLYQFIFHIGLQDENVSILRIFGTFSHPNVYSIYLFSLIVFGVLYLLLFAGKGVSRIVMLGILSIFSVMLFITFARVAWVALFFFMILVALFRYRLLLVPLFLFPFVLFVFSSSFQSRIVESFHPNPDSSLLWRQTLWNDVVTRSLQNDALVFGSGMDTFPKVSESVRGTKNGPNDPHNDFVKFFVEGGIVGTAVFLLYLFSLGSLLLKKYTASQRGSALQIAFGILFLFFLALELSSLTDNIFKNTPVQWLFFIAFGALLSLSSQNKKNT